MQRLIFEHSPYYLVFCLGAGLIYAFILYRSSHLWSRNVNRLLFFLRATLVCLLAFLLLGPIIKLITHEYEKPNILFLIDNSASIGEVIDTLRQQELTQALGKTSEAIRESGYEVVWKDLTGKEINSLRANGLTSDLSKAIQSTVNEYEGRNLAALVLVSDGIYNSGVSPLYTSVRLPIHAVGLGDTTERVDLVLKNITYNKVAYQGNRFPLKAQVLVRGLEETEVSVAITKDGKELATLRKNSGNRSIIDFDFILDAAEKGMQRYDVAVKAIAGESNTRNNRASVFIEVVEGKKKILLIAPAPHPDIKALRAVVEKNSNYEFIVHIPGLSDTKDEYLRPGAAELVIFHQAIDMTGKTWPLYNTLSKGPSSVLMILGGQTNFRQLPAMNIPVQFEFRGQWDEVTPVINSEFRDFTFSDNSNGVFVRYPPAQVPFGKFTYPAKAKVILQQRIGSVTTSRPMLFAWEDNNRKVAVMIGEGIWRWRLGEFADNNNSEAFDELFSKLVQYLSTLDDKSKFRCFPLQNEFSDAEPAVFETQVYNDLFELVYGHTIELQLRDDKGKVTHYNYTTAPGSSRYRIGGLKEGVYRYKASTTIGNKSEEVNGQFLVKAQNLELQNLTADFQLLRKLAYETGGKFYRADQLDRLQADLQNTKATSLIHSEETFNPLINLKWVFFLLLALISVEWFLRKYLGGY
jgi:hypothetical protein